MSRNPAAAPFPAQREDPNFYQHDNGYNGYDRHDNGYNRQYNDQYNDNYNNNTYNNQYSSHYDRQNNGYHNDQYESQYNNQRPLPSPHHRMPSPNRPLPSNSRQMPPPHSYQPASSPNRSLPSPNRPIPPPHRATPSPAAAAYAHPAAELHLRSMQPNVTERSPQDDPFTNRNNVYPTSPYSDMLHPSARSSRVEFDDIDPVAIADEDYSVNTMQQQRLKLPGITTSTAAAYTAIAQKGPDQLAQPVSSLEKEMWKRKEVLAQKKRKRWLWFLVPLIVILIVGGASAGIVLGLRKNSGSSTTKSEPTDTLNSTSPQIKSLLRNNKLHKVFPVLDYTPYNTQYPDCLHWPPSQDNVTMDMTVLSQLTNTVRVYGTDCNQVEMIFSAMDRLGLNDTMSMWLGVWIDKNQTTNARQLSQMYDVLTKYPSSFFKGVIVGNEVLFRKDLDESGLIDLLNTVRSNFTSLGIELSVSTSDLGSAWTADLAAASDHVMANNHPFFAGVTADVAAAWTWNFWQQVDVAIAPEPTDAAAGSIPRNIISEVGWPSAGGNHCGTGSACTSPTDGSVASVSEMNTFMSNWVCQANANNTMYFWFEAFDEPWKIIYDTPTEAWEGE